jgi:hypothetical protein
MPASLRIVMRILAVVLLGLAGPSWAQEPPVIDPFDSRPQDREDAVPGYLEMSNGTVHPGQLFLTRDLRLKIFDEKEQRQREIPFRAIRQIECRVLNEWLEKEWRFKENANDEKVYTGRSYPVREYVHVITLTNSKTIQGPLSGIVYVQAEGSDAPEKYLLHKRDKGEPGTELKSLLYVRSIRLGADALKEGKDKAIKK